MVPNAGLDASPTIQTWSQHSRIACNTKFHLCALHGNASWNSGTINPIAGDIVCMRFWSRAGQRSAQGCNSVPTKLAGSESTTARPRSCAITAICAGVTNAGGTTADNCARFCGASGIAGRCRAICSRVPYVQSIAVSLWSKPGAYFATFSALNKYGLPVHVPATHCHDKVFDAKSPSNKCPYIQRAPTRQSTLRMCTT